MIVGNLAPVAWLIVLVQGVVVSCGRERVSTTKASRRQMGCLFGVSKFDRSSGEEGSLMP